MKLSRFRTAIFVVFLILNFKNGAGGANASRLRGINVIVYIRGRGRQLMFSNAASFFAIFSSDFITIALTVA
ncbi:MAG TPA: hypothetical protein VJ729_10700 [Nitrososphaeraceae archaeon]|nr:hypothetical protein [Nitrososphaeraceae archaeon]